MKRALLFAILATLSLAAGAQCRPSLPVSGVESVRACDRKTTVCVDPEMALARYAERVEGFDDPAVPLVFIHASPWRFYDAESRIVTVAELADNIRPSLHRGVKRINLVASWSGVRPEPGTPSLAEQLSTALGGTPVTGADGFLWINRYGRMRTTRQMATTFQGTGYTVPEGGEVFISLAAGWRTHHSGHYASQRDAEGLLNAGVGSDLYMLCPEQALETFEYSALLGNPVAAYNAAVMRLERNGPGDAEAATALLSKAAKAGDDPARKRLEALRSSGRLAVPQANSQ